MVDNIPKPAPRELHSLRRSSLKRKQPLELFDCVAKRRKLSPSILDLPVEMLLMIFSFLPRIEVFFQLSSVCKQWRNVIRDPRLWKKVILERSTPDECLPIWLTNLPQLEHLVVDNRTNVNAILEIVSQNCEHLESLELSKCYGSYPSKFISSRVMCNMAKTCKKLRHIRIEQTLFNSWTFLQCLAKNTENNRIKGGYYKGPVDKQNWLTFLCKLEQNGTAKTISLSLIRLSQLKYVNITLDGDLSGLFKLAGM